MATSRRKFIKSVLGTAGVVTLSPTLSLASEIGQHTAQEDALSFVKANGRGPRLDAPDVEQQFIPLHQERLMANWQEQTSQHQQAKQLLSYELAKEGMRWREDYKLHWTYQHYGVPDRGVQCQRMMKYCEKVQDFLLSQLELEPVAIAWHPLRENDPSYGNRVNAAIGKHNYFVMRVGILDGDNNLLEPYLAKAKVVERAVNHISIDSQHQLRARDSSIYLILGQTALVSPFSETIHLSTHIPAMHYEEQLRQHLSATEARSKARYIGETVTESAAVLLALKFVDQLHPSYSDYVVRMANSLSRQLPYFQHSVAYMQKYGVKNTLKHYQQDPAAYLESIKAMI